MRAKERLQIDCPKQLGALAERALKEGINACLDPFLRELCYEKALATGLDGVYVLEEKVFLFKENALITVMPQSYLKDFNLWHKQKAQDQAAA